MTDAAAERPYLDTPIPGDATPTLLQWAKYLGRTFGAGGALCALRHYERLSWLSPAARRDVERRLQGLSIEEIHSKKYDEPTRLTGPLASLSGTPFGAHAKSLEFIARLTDADLKSELLRARLAKHRAGVADVDSTDRDAPSPS